jgi:hypothetical protein
MTNYNKLHPIPFPQFHSNPFEWPTSISIQLSLISTTTKPLVIAFSGLLMDTWKKNHWHPFKCILKLCIKNSSLLIRGMGEVLFVAKCWNETGVEWNSTPL